MSGWSAAPDESRRCGAQLVQARRADASRLLELVELFLAYQADGPRAARMAAVRRHLDETYFYWIGGRGDDDPFYYRILVRRRPWSTTRAGPTAGERTSTGWETAVIKVAAPRTACWVIDRAIQAHGGLGVSQDTPLAEMDEQARMLRIADGPDEVHKVALARRELRRYREAAGV